MVVLALAGCSSRPVHAPVVDRVPPPARAPIRPIATEPPRPAETDARPELYVVKRGDTLYSIALDHGLDYKEFAVWNNLDNPNVIRVGQALRIKPPPGVQEESVTVTPVAGPGSVGMRLLPENGAVKSEPRALPEQGSVKSEPRARKLPYSEENVALLQGGGAPAKGGPKSEPEPALGAAKQEQAAKAEAGMDDEDKVDWGRPASGRVIAVFSEPSNKGMDIAGKLGDPVIAAAPGRVIYSGEMRGYGKLAVIKHNKSYSSVYAHNRDILVKEGQSVLKGQKIAEIGSTDSDAPKLHFEIRKLGKPIDPAKFLPPP